MGLNAEKDALPFNQLFNVCVPSENIPFDEMLPNMSTIRALIELFHGTYAKGRADGTINGRMIAVGSQEKNPAVNDAARLTVAYPPDADAGFVRAFVVAPGTMLPLRDAWLLQIQ